MPFANQACFHRPICGFALYLAFSLTGQHASAQAPPPPPVRQLSPASQTSPVPQAGKPRHDKAFHLNQAAKHLAAAGKEALAERVANDAIIEGKLQQIREIQAQIRQLGGAADSGKTFIINVKLVELQIGRLRKLGLDFQSSHRTGRQSLDDVLSGPAHLSDVIGPFMTALSQHDLAKVLAEPTMVVADGRPASLQSGGEVPIQVPQSDGKLVTEYRQFGTRLDCVARSLDDGRIRLDLRVSVSEIDTTKDAAGVAAKMPRFRTRMIDTAVELNDGQAVVLRGLVQDAGPTPTDEYGKTKSGKTRFGKTKLGKTELIAVISVKSSEPVAKR